jgi:hypothetical protein
LILDWILTRVIQMLVAPYVAFVGWAIGGFYVFAFLVCSSLFHLYCLLGCLHTSRQRGSEASLLLLLRALRPIVRLPFMCSLLNHYSGIRYSANAMAIFSSAVCLVTTLLEIHLGFLLYRNWRALRAAGQSSGVDMPFVLRTFVFGLYIVAGMVISLATVWNPTTSLTDLYGASSALTFSMSSLVHH